MEYAFECRKCGERFHVTESLAEHDEHREKCPKCGSREVEQRIERVHVKTARKS
jgi:putative FmdB family regulatory protein